MMIGTTSHSEHRARPAAHVITALTAAAVVVLALVGHASAASSVRACFTYQGAGVPGVGTVLEYHTASGTWAYLGTPARTGADGCIRYTIGTRDLYLRVRAGAALRDGRTIASAASRYASPGDASYWLGSTPLSFSTLDSPWWDVTSTWLDEMSNPSCDDNATMVVACYLRSTGMATNPIAFPDSDRDGIWDLADRYWQDARYH